MERTRARKEKRHDQHMNRGVNVLGYPAIICAGFDVSLSARSASIFFWTSAAPLEYSIRRSSTVIPTASIDILCFIAIISSAVTLNTSN